MEWINSSVQKWIVYLNCNHLKTRENKNVYYIIKKIIKISLYTVFILK